MKTCFLFLLTQLVLVSVSSCKQRSSDRAEVLSESSPEDWPLRVSFSGQLVKVAIETDIWENYRASFFWKQQGMDDKRVTIKDILAVKALLKHIENDLEIQLDSVSPVWVSNRSPTKYQIQFSGTPYQRAGDSFVKEIANLEIRGRSRSQRNYGEYTHLNLGETPPQRGME
jgi:hypothetical protein